LAAGIMFITLQTQTVIIGLILGAIVTAWQVRTLRRERASPELPRR